MREKLRGNRSLLWLVVISWFFLYLAGLIITSLVLTPWDTSIVGRPSMDSWQGALNRFFETWPGSQALSIVIVSVSVYLFLTKLKSQSEALVPLLILRFSFTNFIFVYLFLPLILVTTKLYELSLPLISRDSLSTVGYARTWPSIGMSLIIALILLLVQWHGITAFRFDSR